MKSHPFTVFSLCVLALLMLFAWPAQKRAAYALPLDAAAIIQLTTNPAIDVRPAWSPDGRSIAFQSNRDGPFHIYVMEADGRNQRALTKGSKDDRHPVWMPDGKSILFDSSDGQKREIWSVGVADGSLKQLTRVGALANFAAPSPDGQRIVFYVFSDPTLDLWAARIDGSDAKPLTHDLASAENNQCTFACHQAAWSADGRTIAYSGGDHHSVWTIGGDGSNARQIIADEEHNHFPWFLADGRLGIITEHVSSAESWTAAWAYDLQSRQRALLQERMSPQGPFEWSSDNQKVLFHSPRAGNFDIYLVDLNVAGGLAALQGTPVPATRAESTTADTAPAPAATAAFVPAPGSTSEASASDNASGLRWIAGIVMAGVVAAFVIALVRDRR